MYIVLLFVLIWPFLSLSAIAQTASDSGLNVPPGHARIPVFVTDRQGKLIQGLRVDDFKVLDNGKPSTIEAFPSIATTPSTQAHFTVFYLDDRHLNMEEMNKAKKDIAAALFTGTGSTNSGFSQSPDQLRQTLASIHATAVAQGAAAHNFDLIGTYASLADYASRMAKLPGRRLIVVLSPGFSSDFPDIPEIRVAADASIDRIVQSGVVLNAFNTQDSTSGSRNGDDFVLEELTSSPGGSLFLSSTPPLTFAQYPEILYLLDISISAIRADGSTHLLKVVVNRPGSRVHTRQNFVAPRPNK
jgi:VWFA-related protein